MVDKRYLIDTQSDTESDTGRDIIIDTPNGNQMTNSVANKWQTKNRYNLL